MVEPKQAVPDAVARKGPRQLAFSFADKGKEVGGPLGQILGQGVDVLHEGVAAVHTAVREEGEAVARSLTSLVGEIGRLNDAHGKSLRDVVSNLGDVKSALATLGMDASDRDSARSEQISFLATKIGEVQAALQTALRDSEGRVVGKLDDVRGKVLEAVKAVAKDVAGVLTEFNGEDGKINQLAEALGYNLEKVTASVEKLEAIDAILRSHGEALARIEKLVSGLPAQGEALAAVVKGVDDFARTAGRLLLLSDAILEAVKGGASVDVTAVVGELKVHVDAQAVEFKAHVDGAVARVEKRFDALQASLAEGLAGVTAVVRAAGFSKSVAHDGPAPAAVRKADTAAVPREEELPIIEPVEVPAARYDAEALVARLKDKKDAKELMRAIDLAGEYLAPEAIESLLYWVDYAAPFRKTDAKALEGNEGMLSIKAVASLEKIGLVNNASAEDICNRILLILKSTHEAGFLDKNEFSLHNVKTLVRLTAKLGILLPAELRASVKGELEFLRKELAGLGSDVAGSQTRVVFRDAIEVHAQIGEALGSFPNGK